MYHVQVPPPLHKFMPTLAGIGWVDLVFPFFLFCQGAAIPLAMCGPTQAWQQVVFTAARRGLLIAGLALFYFQLRPGGQTRLGEVGDAALAIVAFGLLCLALTRRAGRAARVVRGAALAVSATLMLGLPAWQGEAFDPRRSDIILMVLANMAFFGSLIFHFTRTHPVLRLALLLLACGQPAGLQLVGQGLQFGRPGGQALLVALGQVGLHGGQGLHHLGGFVDFEEAPARNLRQHVVDMRLLHLVEDARARRGRRHAVDRDIHPGEFLAERLGEADHARFRRRIGRGVGIAFFARDRGDVDEPPAPAAAQRR
jgi:hypothetical protein